MKTSDHQMLVVLIGASGVGKSTLLEYVENNLSDRAVVLRRHTNRAMREAAEAREIVELTDAQFDAARDAGEFATYYERYTHKYAVRYDELERVQRGKIGVVVIPGVALPMLQPNLGSKWDLLPCWLDITPENRERRYLQREDEESKATKPDRLSRAPIDHSKVAEVKIDANGSRESVSSAFVAWFNKISGAHHGITAEALTEAYRVFELLENKGTPWCLFGGFAARWHGGITGRPPTDLDIVVQTDDLGELASCLHGFERKRETVLQGTFVEVRAARLSLHVDGKPFPWVFDEQARARLGRCRLGPWTVPVLSAEDTVVMKCILQRGAGKHDLEDVSDILAARAARLDKDYIVSRSERCQSKDRVVVCLSELGYAC